MCSTLEKCSRSNPTVVGSTPASSSVKETYMLLNYIKWCWIMKEILPWQVSLVRHEELAQEEYEYPNWRIAVMVSERFAKPSGVMSVVSVRI